MAAVREVHMFCEDFVDVCKLTNGRDKLMRIIQYLARYWGNTWSSAANVPVFKALEANISAGRKREAIDASCVVNRAFLICEPLPQFSDCFELSTLHCLR